MRGPPDDPPEGYVELSLEDRPPPPRTFNSLEGGQPDLLDRLRASLFGADPGETAGERRRHRAVVLLTLTCLGFLAIITLHTLANELVWRTMVRD